MAELYTLLHGNAKSRMKPIMTDLKRKCENYMKARVATRVGGHHEIVPAEKGAKVWRKNNSGPWTGYDDIGPGRS